MKQKILTLILGCLCSIVGLAQTPKYGVVDVDSVVMSISDVRAIVQQMDSIQKATYASMMPLQQQLAAYQEQLLSLSRTDTIAQRRINEDAELTYQEIRLIEQKGNRAFNSCQEQLKPYIDRVNNLINDIGEKLNLTFVIKKEIVPGYIPTGITFAPALTYLFESPLYFSGEAIDITQDLIKALNPPTTPKKSSAAVSKNNQIKNRYE